jgi:hypothetical protein
MSLMHKTVGRPVGDAANSLSSRFLCRSPPLDPGDFLGSTATLRRAAAVWYTGQYI